VRGHDGVHRYYDPSTGQFLNVDPLVDETDTPYAYSAGNPINEIDPSGLADRTPLHNQAVSLTVAALPGSYPAELRGHISSICAMNACNAIPGASKKRNGNTGYADIVVLDYQAEPPTAYIWEVKKYGSISDSAAQAEAAWYVLNFKQQNPGWRAELGFAVGNAPNFNGLDTWSDPTLAGVRWYSQLEVTRPRVPDVDPRLVPYLIAGLGLAAIGQRGAPEPGFRSTLSATTTTGC